MDNNYDIKLFYDSSVDKIKIDVKTASLLEGIRNEFTRENPEAFFIERYGHRVDPVVCPINILGFFQIGLFTLIYKKIKELYVGFNVIIQNQQKIIDKIYPLLNILNTTNILDKSNVIKLRPYQKEAVAKILKSGRGLIECPTGSGKSLIIGNVTHNLLSSRLGSLIGYVLIYVPTRQLVNQFYNDLLEIGFTKKEICKFTSNEGKKRDNNFEDNSCSNGFNKIIIANRDFLLEHSKELPNISILFVDEVHKIKYDSSTYNFVKAQKTDIKIGLTGTLPNDDYKLWMIMGLFGNVLFRDTIISLQEQEYLAPLKIISISIRDAFVENDRDCLFHTRSNKKFDESDTSDDALAFNAAYNAEAEYVIKNFYKLYSKPLEYICGQKENRNILILFDRTDLGMGIYEYAKANIKNFQSFYIDGSIDIKIRDKICLDFEQGDNKLLFAQSTTFSTGINIKNLDVISFFFTGKGYTKIIQSIGRTLRLHKNKDYAKLYDISFNYKYSQKHKADRFDIYTSIYGKENYDSVETILI